MTRVRDRILAPSAQIDPAQLEQVNWDEATRDAMRAAGFKPNWFKPIEAIQQKREENARAAEIQQGIETLGAGGEAAQQVAGAVQAIDQA
jgi:hypothetical protein